MSKKITPGIYPDITIGDYHSGPGVSNSGVKLLLECPKKYQHRYLLEGEPHKSTTPMLEGNQFHTYILEPEKFNSQYFVSDKIVRRGKKWDEVVDSAEGKQIIFSERLEELQKMKSSLMLFPRATALLSGGVAESSIYWEDSDTGVLCKSRPDYINFDKKFITDLKTTENASFNAFSKSVVKYNYHVQAALMLDGFKAVTGEDISGVFNFAIEKAPPYCCCVFMIDDAAIDRGRQEYKKALRIFSEHDASGVWPSYSDEIEEIKLPSWANSEE